jgi:hypothetical protein
MHSWSSGQLGVHIGSPPRHSPSTHSCPSSQRLEQLPQCLSFCCRFTHLPPQQVCFEPQRLRQLPQWRSFVCKLTHLSLHRVCPLGHRSLAQATPGTEAKAAPTRAPLIHLSALPLEMVPSARPQASSSKECSTLVGFSEGELPPLCPSAVIRVLPSLIERRYVTPPLLLFDGPATSHRKEAPPRLCAPPHDGFALLVAAHTRMHMPCT